MERYKVRSVGYMPKVDASIRNSIDISLTLTGRDKRPIMTLLLKSAPKKQKFF